MLSVGGADDEGVRRVWDWYEEAAQEAGREVSRKDWKVVTAIHIAESRQQAIADVRRRLHRPRLRGDARDPNRGGGLFANQAATIEEAIDKGQVIVGSPDDAIDQIDALHDRAGGNRRLAGDGARMGVDRRDAALLRTADALRGAGLSGPAGAGAGVARLRRRSAAGHFRGQREGDGEGVRRFRARSCRTSSFRQGLEAAARAGAGSAGSEQREAEEVVD